jgi:hypothetical protein
MKPLMLYLCMLVLSHSLGSSQTTPKHENTNIALEKAVLLSDLRTLALEIPKLDGQLARAMAKAEIADAAWFLDRGWAKKLLREAYELTYLTEEEFRQVGPELPGSASRPPTVIGRARDNVRKCILSIARRDALFADQLLTDKSARVSKDDRQMMYAQLTRMALDGGDNQAAVRSIQDNMALDPAGVIFVELVHDLSAKDRAEADRLILECIAKLSNVRLADEKLARGRAIMTLMWLVFPNSFLSDPAKQNSNPGPDVMKAYVRYVIEDLTALEEREPGRIAHERYFLLSAWVPLNKYAPEYKERFMQLEALSRTPGKDASLPTKGYGESHSEPNEQSIDSVILRGEFETARKLISKLFDGPQKTQFLEKVNTKEALNLARQGDLLGAQNLAERLTSMNSIVQVYPAIVEGYVKNKDQTSAGAAVRQAVKQLRFVNSKPVSPTAQFGMPAEFAPTPKERDGTLAVLGRLAQAILPIDSLLAAEIVDEIVVSANRSEIDTSQGQTGIDSELFKQFAGKDEVRAHSAAESFKDRLRRIVATAAIYQWKAKQLEPQKGKGTKIEY